MPTGAPAEVWIAISIEALYSSFSKSESAYAQQTSLEVHAKQMELEQSFFKLLLRLEMNSDS